MLAATDTGLLEWLLVVLQVAVGLGTVIFVHELGHFAVAKMCGVKCEKFFIGFDIGGYKLSRKWGETEYGIGILPLGGYVKMLGQDDNPANIAEQVRESEVAGNTIDAKEITGPDGKKYLVDRRSYLAKSVPQRMAIISAGVIMNIIFAFIFATVAYKIGVPYNPTIVSKTAPGSPAWRAALRPGDEIVRVGDIEKPTFQDLMGSVTLGDLKKGLPFEIQRGSEKISMTLVPEQGNDLARIGVTSPSSLRVHPRLAVLPGTAADQAKPPLQSGDEIVKVDGQPVEDYAAFSNLLVQHPEKPLILTVRRGGKPPEDDRFGELSGGEMLEVTVPPRPLRTLGLVMQMGKIVAVQEGSPAAEAGIKAGDFIDRIEPTSGEAGSLGSDPLTLPEDLRRMAEEGRDVKVTLRPAGRGDEGREPPAEKTIALRKVRWLEEPFLSDPVAATAAGIAYRVLSVVDRVEPGSPAEKAGLLSDDVIQSVEVIYPKDLKDVPEGSTEVKLSQTDDDGEASWAGLMGQIQSLPPGTKLKFQYKRGDKVQEAVLEPVTLDGYFNPDRGILFEAITRIRIVPTWGEAVERGRNETVRALTMVYRFLNKLGTGQVPLTALGGPMTIAQVAGFSAFEGLGKLLVFLTMLSANLAVINFLPIPLLDGGHMVFLLWEGIRGKPAGEKFVVAMHTIGFVFIITLMLFVFGLDIRRMFFSA
jgi:regulator of sigma E protease